MKKRILLTLFFGVIFAASALAGPANIEGLWTGDGEAILPDGVKCVINSIEGDVSQDGTLLYGTFDFTISSGPCPGGEDIPFTGNISAGNRIKALLFVPGVGGIGVLDAKLRGKTISGVLVDLSDGSTTIFSVTPDD
jgi:hypothetical protein